MCGFAGFFDLCGNITENKQLNLAVVRRMAKRISLDTFHSHISDSCAITYTQINENNNVRFLADNDLLALLISKDSKDDVNRKGSIQAEQILKLYSAFGESFIDHIAGIYSGVIIDGTRKAIVLYRGRLGSAPIFYTFIQNRMIFSKEIKGLFEYPGIQTVLSIAGIAKMFLQDQAKYDGKSVFEDIFSLPLSCTAVFNADGFTMKKCSEKMYLGEQQ